MKRPRRKTSPWMVMLLGGNLVVLLVLQVGLAMYFARERSAEPVRQPLPTVPEPMQLLDPSPEAVADPLPRAPVLQRAAGESAAPAATPEPSVTEPQPSVATVRMANYPQVRTDLMDVADALVRLNARLVEAHRPGVAKR